MLHYHIRDNLRLFSGAGSIIAVEGSAKDETLKYRKKSNFWISVMSASILWHEYKIYVPVMFHADITPGEALHVIDLDDCGYTGNQTSWYILHIMNRLTAHVSNKRSVGILRGPERRKNDLDLIEMQKHMTRNHICRIFASASSMQNWRSYLVRKNGKLSTIITVHAGQEFDDLETQVGHNAYNIMAHYLSPWTDANGDPAKTAIYFDHKLADSVSTLLIPLMFGTVLPYTVSHLLAENDVDALAPRFNPAPEEDAPDASFPEQFYEIGSLINGCKNEELENLTIAETLEYTEVNARCPIAWYKYIDYDAATLALPCA